MQLIRTPRKASGGSRPRNKEQSLLDLPSTTTSGSSRSSVRRAPARRCSPSRRGCRRRWRRASTRSSSSPGPSSRSGATSATCRSVEEKLNPLMQPIFDNVEYLMNLSRSDKKPGAATTSSSTRHPGDRAAHVHPRPLDPEPVHHRGRGAEPHAARGEDHHHARGGRHEDRPHRRPLPDRQPVRGSDNNGLIHVVKLAKGERLAGHITLSKGWSPLAELAAICCDASASGEHGRSSRA